jgi:phosphoglycerate dehydrogenase-like enzyme
LRRAVAAHDRRSALDVSYRYPREAGPTAPATRPFRELPNILMMPHVSGWTGGTLDALAKAIAENIRRMFGIGGRPESICSR